MLDFLRRNGLDRWGPLTCVLFVVVAAVVVTVAVLILVTRPSVDEVIKAAEALATAAVAIAGTIIGHAHLQGTRELASATREAAAMSAPVPLQAVAVGQANATIDSEVDAPLSAAAASELPTDDDEFANAPRPGSASRPDPVEGHHGPDDLPPA